jgi:hypothetical protein
MSRARTNAMRMRTGSSRRNRNLRFFSVGPAPSVPRGSVATACELPMSAPSPVGPTSVAAGATVEVSSADSGSGGGRDI